MTLLNAHVAKDLAPASRAAAPASELSRRIADERTASESPFPRAMPIRILASVRWPCLARALQPDAHATAELMVEARLLVSGPAHALSGRLEIVAMPSSGHAAPGASPEGTHLLADIAVHGTMASSPGWTHLSVVGGEPTRGTCSLDLTLPALTVLGGGDRLGHADANRSVGETVGAPSGDAADFATATAPSLGTLTWASEAWTGPWHVRTSLFRWLSVPGGRYGQPHARCSVEPAAEG